MSHSSLQNHLIFTFDLMKEVGASFSDIESMMIFERDAFLALARRTVNKG